MSESPARVPARARPMIDERLRALTTRARLVLWWEALWPALWWPLGTVIVFLILSLLGLWDMLPTGARPYGVGLAALVLLASLVPLVRISPPTRQRALARIDRDSPAPHRPAAALADSLAGTPSDPGTLALWDALGQRAAAAMDSRGVAPPRPGRAARDPFAVRGSLIVVLAAALIAAGSDVVPRLTTAFDWQTPQGTGPAFRIDGWIDPPHYTRLPPLLLDLRGGDVRQAKAPVGSTVVVRAAGSADLSVSAGRGLASVEKPAGGAPAGLTEHRFTVKADDELVVSSQAGTSRVVIEATPDMVPTVAFSGEPQNNSRGSITLTYRMRDDYGIDTAEALVAPLGREGARTLVPPPRIPLALPIDPAADEDTRTTNDLSASPWAGATVAMTLVARDHAGQEGRSETKTVVLPQRPFTKPLAKALVEQRRNLVLAPDERNRVQTALDALLIAPEDFTPELGIYVGLGLASTRLAAAKSDEELLDVAELLWAMALQIEDGGMSQAERDLRAAQEALRQALERGADEEEIRRLTDELRQAMNNFLREFAQRMQQNPGQPNQARPDANARTVTPQDLDNLLNRLEELARQGATADAQRLLDELRNILENLQTARPNQGGDQFSQEMNRSLNELDEMMRDQRNLRDDTYRQSAPWSQQNRGGQRQRGQQGQRGENQGQQAQPGQDGQQGEDGQGLTDRQQALRERLEELRRRMRDFGLEDEPGFGEAEEAMREAEGQLGQGQSGDAVDAQGRALDALQRGAQGLAQQMQGNGQPQQADGSDGPPQQGATGPGGPRNEDPLGRPTRNRDWSDGRVRIPGADESAAVRARRILDELRRRLGDPTRPSEEIDYLERLLRRN